MPNFSQRLSAIASLVPENAYVADIGTDHAYLPIELISSKKAKRVIATDIGEKPLENAKKNIEKMGISNIELRLCDGLSGIGENEADTIVIAGMGGEVISGILERSMSFCKNRELTFIFQPTTSPEALRHFLCLNGFLIEKEIPVFENDKLYSVMLVRFDGKKKNYNEAFYFIGLVPKDTEAGILYIKKQKMRCFKCFSAMENLPDKHNEYLRYKTAYLEIDKAME